MSEDIDFDALLLRSMTAMGHPWPLSAQFNEICSEFGDELLTAPAKIVLLDLLGV